MESRLMGVKISNQEVVGCWEIGTELGAGKAYNINYRCLKCGSHRNISFKFDKHSILRCDRCNTRGYISPIVIDDKIVGFNTYTESQWKKRNKKINIAEE